ncbi:MAG: ComEC/Rec2 family competence protein, partial [Oscillospiraceae bacterium]|nr:ComEC/Rec2 family competence protein [Oscillospiraceae bacterium]
MRKLATWGFSFAAAVTVSEYLLTDKAKLTLAAAVLLLFFVNLFIKHGQRKRFSFILAGLCIGFVYTPLYSYLFIPQPEIRYGVLTEWEAEASDFPQTNKNGASLSVLIDAGGATQEAVIYVYDGSADGVKPGDRLRFTAKLYAVDGGADEESYFSRGDKVAASGAYDLEITRPAAGVTLRYFHKYAAKAIKDALKSVFPEKEYPLTLALITGDKSLIRSDRALTTALQRSGVYHVTTVSGMHVSILASFILLLFGKRRGAGFILAPVLIAFAALAGFTPSVTRAVIMQLFVIAAPIFKREEDRLTSIAAALILIIAVDPSSAMSAGLQLSFAAILGISLFYGRIFGAITGFGRIEKIKNRRLRGVFVKLAGAASVTIGAQILTIPLSALHFGYISLAALPANMLITFAVSPAFILSAVSAGAGALYLPVGKAIAFVASLLLKCISWVAKLLSSSALSAVYVDNWVIIAWLILAYAAIIAFIIMRKEANRLILPLCASAAA